MKVIKSRKSFETTKNQKRSCTSRNTQDTQNVLSIKKGYITMSKIPLIKTNCSKNLHQTQSNQLSKSSNYT